MKGLLLCVFLGCCLLSPFAAADEAEQRGAWLAMVGGCDDCHTPLVPGPEGPAPDMSRRLSGHPAAMAVPPAPASSGPWLWAGLASNTGFAGPWGVSFATNLTPSPTGIGAWTEAEFIATLRTGRHLGVGREILPPMPWRNLGGLSDDDLKALFAFLRSLPPIDNQVPAARPPA